MDNNIDVEMMAEAEAEAEAYNMDEVYNLLRQAMDVRDRVGSIVVQQWWPQAIFKRYSNLKWLISNFVVGLKKCMKTGQPAPYGFKRITEYSDDLQQLQEDLGKFASYKIMTGWEFEATGASYDSDISDTSELPWDRVSDGSVNGSGWEYRLRKPDGLVKGLENLLELIKKRKPVVDTSCGAHFHFSVVKDFSDKQVALSKGELEQWATYVYVFAKIVEDEVLKCVPESRVDNRYCRRLALPNGNKLRKSMGRIHGYKYNNNYRYQWVNFIELWRRGGIRTIEFRIMGNTVRPHYLAAGYVLWATIVKEALRVTICGSKNKDILPEAMSSIQAALRVFRKAWEDKSDVNTEMVKTAKLQMDSISEQAIIKG